MGWSVAAILYVLPVLAGIRDFEGIKEDCKDWMRSDEGEWFPALAGFMAAFSLVLWPLVVALDAITPTRRDDP